MWLRTSTFVSFALFLVYALPVNGENEYDTELTSSILSRSSGWDCSSNTDCTASNSTCVNGYCECDSGYAYNSGWTSCLRIATAYGDECTEISQCSGWLLSGSSCRNGTCVCGDGSHYTRGRCFTSSGLGDACSADVNCYVNADTEATSCVNGVCVCSNGFYQREHRTCRRAGYVVGDECAINLDCQFENGFCDRTTFTCADSTVTVTTALDSNVDSVDDNPYEDNHIVRSHGRADGNVTVGTACESNNDCATLQNSRCSSDKTCICTRAFYASEDLSTCLPEIGEDCDSDDEVIIRNSLCRNGTWSCGYSTVTSMNQRICRKSTKFYNWSCLHDEQCYIFGSDSSCQNKRCLCNEGSHLVEDKFFCWVNKGIGESCLDDEDCYVPDLNLEFTCTNSVCTCPNGTQPTSDRTNCLNSEAELGDVCEDNANCVAMNSACIDSICACPDNYFLVDGYCGAGINATCISDSYCYVDNSACNEFGVCDCAENFVIGDANTCLALSYYGGECTSDIQCSFAMDHTYCATTNSTCLCESGYHYRFDACNRINVLGDSCTALTDCYVESGIEDLVCRKGTCACSFESTAVGTTNCSRTSDATTLFLSTWLGLLLLGVKTFLV